jgi:hypothetical protein
MDLAATLFSSGWASGVNSYATVLVLALLGRSGVAGVPEELQSDPVLFVAAGMYAVEFVADKVAAARQRLGRRPHLHPAGRRRHARFRVHR